MLTGLTALTVYDDIPSHVVTIDVRLAPVRSSPYPFQRELKALLEFSALVPPRHVYPIDRPRCRYAPDPPDWHCDRRFTITPPYYMEVGELHDSYNNPQITQ